MNWIFNGRKISHRTHCITYCTSKVYYIRELSSSLEYTIYIYLYTRIIIIIIVYFLEPPPLGDSEGCHADNPTGNIPPSLLHTRVNPYML